MVVYPNTTIIIVVVVGVANQSGGTITRITLATFPASHGIPTIRRKRGHREDRFAPTFTTAFISSRNSTNGDGVLRCKLKNCTAFPPGPRRCWVVSSDSVDDDGNRGAGPELGGSARGTSAAVSLGSRGAGEQRGWLQGDVSLFSARSLRMDVMTLYWTGKGLLTLCLTGPLNEQHARA